MTYFEARETAIDAVGKDKVVDVKDGCQVAANLKNGIYICAVKLTKRNAIAWIGSRDCKKYRLERLDRELLANIINETVRLWEEKKK